VQAQDHVRHVRGNEYDKGDNKDTYTMQTLSHSLVAARNRTCLLLSISSHGQPRLSPGASASGTGGVPLDLGVDGRVCDSRVSVHFESFQAADEGKQGDCRTQKWTLAQTAATLWFEQCHFNVRFKIMKSGIKLIEETEGQGPAAEQGDTVEFESQAFLSRGDRAQDRWATTTRLGSRQIIAGVEYSLIGMKAGGYRKVKISPHLAYRDVGVTDKVPPNAVMIFELWMNGITKG
jgi:FKBP-type peptidyl-prolyl cis-trans isomerase